MSKFEKSPPISRDARRKSALDKIRTRLWYLQLYKVGQFKNNNAVAFGIGGDRETRKWRNYTSAKATPNQVTLELVDSKLPGTLDYFLKGPADTQLWKVLGDANKDELKLIAKYSQLSDGKIAQLKLDLLYDQIMVNHPGMVSANGDEFQERVIEIKESLRNQLPEACAKEIMNLFIMPLAESLYKAAEAKLLDFISDSKYSNEFQQQEAYREMQSNTVGKKGSGGGPRSK